MLPLLGNNPQAIKVLDTYCANMQRQGSGRIQNKAAYLMSLIQSYKLGPTSGTTGSAQRLMERLSPAVSQAVQAVFDPVVDRVVLEDRALMELLAKVPEDQVRAGGWLSSPGGFRAFVFEGGLLPAPTECLSQRVNHQALVAN